jgi:predicted transcriptional regulator
MVEFIKAMNALKENKEYWLTHRIDLIPRPLQRDLDVLFNLELIGDDVDASKIQIIISDLFRSAEARIIGISPVVTLEWARTLVEVAEGGIKVSFIITEKVLETLNKGEYKKHSLLSRLLSHPNVELRVNNNIKLGFVSNGKTFAIGLIGPHGLDIQRGLLGTDPKAIAWVERLYDYYREKSEIVRINE